jgi:carboxylesterase
VLLAIVLLFGSFSFVADWLVSKNDSKAFRNRETGVQRGAEAFTLGHQDASGAVLFVHGFVGGANNFADVPERIAAAGWYVEVLRLPGHGTSPRDLAGISSDELVAYVLQRAQSLANEYKTLVLVGHSMGGALSTLIAAQGLADKLVLAAPYFGVTHRWYYGLRPETWARLTAPIVPWMYKGNLFLQLNRVEAKKDVFSYSWVPAAAVRTLMDLGQRARQPSLLEQVTCPTLMLHAPGDAAASYVAARQAWNLMASEEKRFIELPASNHHVFFDFDREQVAREIIVFIGEPSSP